MAVHWQRLAASARRPVAIARAAYECGCWIDWEDRGGAALPAPGCSGDEFAFAERCLGGLVGERLCQRHGGGIFEAEDPAWNRISPSECLRLHEEHLVCRGLCVRCGSAIGAAPLAVLLRLSLALGALGMIGSLASLPAWLVVALGALAAVVAARGIDP
ncbi:MAG: hypothetical protein ACYDCP_07055 [Thermoplasmataceae archaeon]